MASSNDAVTEIRQIRNDDIFYVKFMKDGSSNMSVDGSTTSVRFTLETLPVDNFILKRIDFLIATDEAIDITKFGNVPTLANGVIFNIDGQQVIKSNGDMLLVGSDTSIHSVKIQSDTVSILNGNWDMIQTFGNGIVCTKEGLYFEIQDDLSGMDYFQISASGIKLGDN